MTTTEIMSVFGRNRPASEIHTALTFLEASGKVKPHGVGNTGGRPATVWEAM